MARVNATLTPAEQDGSRTLGTLAAVIAALYFGRDVFVPIALAILLSFVLAPSIRWLHRLGLGRIFPVLVSTCFAVSIIAALATLVAAQLRNVAVELPRYEDTVVRKVDALRAMSSGSAVKGVEDIMRRLQRATPKEAAPASAAPEGSSAASAPPAVLTPIPVEVQEPAATPLEAARTILAPLVHPLAMGGIVVIFTVFILLQREDLRNRLIRLFGASDLQRTTAAIDDGGKRLSRYLLTQLLLNAGVGLLIGVAALLLGVPNPVLWGILFGCLRFVPYLGPIIGGGLPCLFAAAVTPGWSLALWMFGIVVVVEFLAGQVLEPLLYGHNTGLSPVAVVVSATFWTVLWGPIGLLLSTPLTVCLVVVGRHVDQLEFLDVLLGDRPPLTAPETFYQRMLADDPTEVSEQARDCLKTMPLVAYYDTVVLPGLLLAQEDVAGERLPVERQERIRDATEEVIEDLDDEDASEAKGNAGWRDRLLGRGTDDQERDRDHDTAPPAPAAAWQRDGAVLCIGGRGPLDDCAALMLSQILTHRGIGARSERHTALSKSAIGSLDVANTRLICLSCLDGSSSAYLRFALRRLRRHAPGARILIGAWWMQALADTGPSDDGFTEPRAATIVDASRFCLAAASALTGDDLAAVEASPAGASADA